jgi:chromosomal replication initiation ATPase DnaA
MESFAMTRSKDEKPKVTLALVVDTVSFVLDVNQEHVLARTRYRAATEARQWVCYVLWRAGLSTTRIGEKIGRDHSTVLHGIHLCQDRLKTKEGRQVYDDISKYLVNPKLRGWA